MNKLSLALVFTANLPALLQAGELPNYTCPDLTVDNKPTFDAALDAYCGTSNNYLNSLYVTEGSCSVYCASCTANCCISDGTGVDAVKCADGCDCTICSEPDGCADGKDDEDDDDNVCFHETSTISYKGVQYTMQELIDGKEKECKVPHTPKSKGVIIATSCNKTLRVTDTHLVATTDGYQLAYSLQKGDKLFGDHVSNDDICVVESVTREKTTQQYFGLNCIQSEVLANGLRTSTFGDFHTLPSWYMYYVGGGLGVDLASRLGDYVAEWYYKLK